MFKEILVIFVFLISFSHICYSNDEIEIKKEYYPSGELWEEIFLRDGKEERLKEYYESGKVKSERFYKDGRPEGVSKEYYESGALRFEWFYKDGKPEGIRRGYYESGKLESEWPYKDGKLNGVMKSYHENGDLKDEATYKNDMPAGSRKYYDESGNLTREIGVVEPNTREAKVKIISPKNGNIFHPGDTVHVKVDTVKEVGMVLISAGPYDAALDVDYPFESVFTIPEDTSLGQISIVAGGRSDKGDSFGSDEINIKIEK